jgi:energy-coupling factor transporter ATP-binding protein EcfA2
VAMLKMEEFAGAVIGVPGQGLNVEQRKRLTIGVELAARPELLLFLDEPTSGLDSQTSWAICEFIRELTRSGQAVLCTIHQPSATLFQRFDRLLLLAPGGKTVYFGGDLTPNISLSQFLCSFPPYVYRLTNCPLHRLGRELLYAYPVSRAWWRSTVSSRGQPGRMDARCHQAPAGWMREY